MQLNLTGHHVEITDSLRAYVGSKLTRLERHFDHVTDVHCILTVEKLRHKAEAKLNVSGSTIFADAVEENMYAAIDALADKLDRQIKRHKEKIKAHHDKHDRSGDKRAR
jgi:putative sigma-54 modulation protein